MAETILFNHKAVLDHDTGPGHPECPRRVETLMAHLREGDTLTDVRVVEPSEADLESLETVHDAAYVRRIAAHADLEGLAYEDADTVCSPGSYRAARLAVGAALQAVDEVMAGRADNAFCAMRPPGHHAERDHAMGFCLFNSVAIAARHLQRKHGVDKVAIIDWDVHHGNGTQHSFYEDASVFYCSTHQFPYYPGTGAAGETGRGPGAGSTLNVPLPAGSGDDVYVATFEERVAPAIAKFAPEFVLLSAGFDAHRLDPLAQMQVTEAGFAALTRVVKGIAADACDGRLVSLLEGGYDWNATARSVATHVQGLKGESQ